MSRAARTQRPPTIKPSSVLGNHSQPWHKRGREDVRKKRERERETTGGCCSSLFLPAANVIEFAVSSREVLPLTGFPISATTSQNPKKVTPPALLLTSWIFSKALLAPFLLSFFNTAASLAPPTSTNSIFSNSFTVCQH